MCIQRMLSLAAVVTMMSSQAIAQSVVAVPSAVVNAQGNRVWTVVATPSLGDLPGSLAAELEFTITNGSAAGTLSVIDSDPDNTNGGPNDTWYFNETSAGSGTLVWNITENDPSDETQNPNPFVPGTDGLQVDGATVSVGLGSTIFPDTTTSVNVMQIVTSGGGGILQMSEGNLAQAAQNNIIAAANFFVPGDFTGDGVVGSDDVTALLGAFGQPAANFPGFQPVTGDNMAGSGDVTALLGNFGAGQQAPAGLAVGAASIPEPSSILLVIGSLGIAAGIAARRRLA